MQPEETPAQPASPQANPEPAPAPAASLRDAKLESAHAELPPMSVIGGDATPAAKPGEIAKPKQFGRRGTPQGMPSPAAGNSPSIGAVSDPADLTEKLSGQHAAGYSGGAPAGEPRPPREPREPRPEGDFRREDRGPRPERGPRPDREPRHEGERRQDGERRREERGPREPRPERARIQIEPVVIPLEPPRTLWGSVKRLLATLWGVPSKAVYTPAPGARPADGERRRDDRGDRGGRGDGRRRDDRGGRGDRGRGRGRGGPRRG